MAEIIALWKPQLKWPSKLSTNLAKLLFNIKLINLTSWGERESALNNFIDSCIYDYINPRKCTMHLFLVIIRMYHHLYQFVDLVPPSCLLVCT